MIDNADVIIGDDEVLRILALLFLLFLIIGGLRRRPPGGEQRHASGQGKEPPRRDCHLGGQPTVATEFEPSDPEGRPSAA